MISCAYYITTTSLYITYAYIHCREFSQPPPMDPLFTLSNVSVLPSNLINTSHIIISFVVPVSVGNRFIDRSLDDNTENLWLHSDTNNERERDAHNTKHCRQRTVHTQREGMNVLLKYAELVISAFCVRTAGHIMTAGTAKESSNRARPTDHVLTHTWLFGNNKLVFLSMSELFLRLSVKWF